MGIFTDLDLDGQSPTRARPRVGEKEWAPVGVPSTRRKKVQRVLAPVAFVVALAVLVGVGWFFFRILVLGG